MTIEVESKKLVALKVKRSALNAEIAAARYEAVRCTREIGEARVSGLVDPEKNPANAVEARVKKLEREFAKAQAEIDKLAPEVSALYAAIEHIEREIPPLRHAERLQKQGALRERYAAVARKMLEAANVLANMTAEAKAIYDGAYAEFPQDETCEGQEMVNRFAGLAPIWDGQWILYGDDNGCRRDVVVNAIWQFDRALVDPEDRVARFNRHQEQEIRRRAEEIERERAGRKWGAPLPPAQPGEQRINVRHPLGLPL
jgi:hypothetical protein